MATQHFGKIVRGRRERLGLSLSEAAERCGLSIRGLELIELGDSDPKLSNVLRIAAALNIDLGDIESCVPVLLSYMQ